MTILYRYLTIEIIKKIFIVLLTVVSIYVAVDFFEKIDNFIEAKLPISKALIFLLYKIPFIVTQILPVCILLAVLIVFGLMNKNNEITALRSSGISIYYLFKPVLGIGVFSCLFLFFFSEIVVPITAQKANQIWLREVKNEAAIISREKNIWLKGKKMITHIAYYDRKVKAIRGVTLYYFDDDFNIARRVDARTGIFSDRQWTLFNLMEQVFDNSEGKNKVFFHDQKIENIGLVPDDLQRVVKKSEEMNYRELKDFIDKVEGEGYDATIYRVDLYAKIAFPFICIILCLVGAGIAAKGKMKEGLPLDIAFGIGITFLYWIFYSFCLSLGYGEMLPPLIAAWTANIIFSCVGMLLLLNSE
ncbi:LPS export ABC transporter permease LptG [Desulfobacterales bacterium HSG16]|nr:LPS export ABC transporter permease LptG [Desulfobacterales bacterium HSG16]